MFFGVIQSTIANLQANGNFTSFKELEKKQDSYRTFRVWNPLRGALDM